MKMASVPEKTTTGSRRLFADEERYDSGLTSPAGLAPPVINDHTGATPAHKMTGPDLNSSPSRSSFSSDPDFPERNRAIAVI
jgi:hypothetical protein